MEDIRSHEVLEAKNILSIERPLLLVKTSLLLISIDFDLSCQAHSGYTTQGKKPVPLGIYRTCQTPIQKLFCFVLMCEEVHYYRNWLTSRLFYCI